MSKKSTELDAFLLSVQHFVRAIFFFARRLLFGSPIHALEAAGTIGQAFAWIVPNLVKYGVTFGAIEASVTTENKWEWPDEWIIVGVSALWASLFLHAVWDGIRTVERERDEIREKAEKDALRCAVHAIKAHLTTPNGTVAQGYELYAEKFSVWSSAPHESVRVELHLGSPLNGKQSYAMRDYSNSPRGRDPTRISTGEERDYRCNLHASIWDAAATEAAMQDAMKGAYLVVRHSLNEKRHATFDEFPSEKSL